MAGEELQVLNVVLPNKSREGVLMTLRELDEDFARKNKERIKKEARIRDRGAKEEEETFYRRYPDNCEDILARVAAKKIGVSEESVKGLTTEQKRNLARMIYEKRSRISRGIKSVLRFVGCFGDGGRKPRLLWYSLCSCVLGVVSVFFSIPFPVLGFLPPVLITTSFLGLCTLFIADSRTLFHKQKLTQFHERFLEIEKKMLAEKSEAEKSE